MAFRLDAHSLTIFRRRLVAAFTQRLPLKATALLLALVLWLVVSAKEPTYAVVQVKFAPRLAGSLVLRDPPPEIHAVVAGTTRELVKLLSSPPVIDKTVAADVPDTLVLDLHPKDVTLPEGVEAFVEDVTPASVTLRFEPTSTRKVAVRSAVTVAGQPSSGPFALRFEPESVEVSGPRLAVFRTSFVSTVKTTLPASDSLPHLVDLDTARLNVRIKPTQVRVKIVSLGQTAAPETVAKPRADSGPGKP